MNGPSANSACVWLRWADFAVVCLAASEPVEGVEWAAYGFALWPTVASVCTTELTMFVCTGRQKIDDCLHTIKLKRTGCLILAPRERPRAPKTIWKRNLKTQFENAIKRLFNRN